jgi:hypothetical protein
LKKAVTLTLNHTDTSTIVNVNPSKITLSVAKAVKNFLKYLIIVLLPVFFHKLLEKRVKLGQGRAPKFCKQEICEQPILVPTWVMIMNPSIINLKLVQLK